MSDTCPPCNHNCNQGRDCPARPRRSLGDLFAALTVAEAAKVPEAWVERLTDTGPTCPFCGRDPYHYVDVGVGLVPAAVECCELGIGLFQYGDDLLRMVSDHMEEAARTIAALRALTTTDAAAALDAIRRQERAEGMREAALREAEKALRDWQDSLNVHRMTETAITVGMAADVILDLIKEEQDE